MTELTLEEYRRLIYTKAWNDYRDPEVPDWIDPVGQILERHIGTPVEGKPALIVDDEPVTYRQLVTLTRQVHSGLVGIGVEPEHRILFFATDSLEYVAMWMGGLRLGAIPAVVSDLYKTKDLLYFLTDTAARFLYIDAEQLPKLEEIADTLPATLRTVIVRGSADLGALAGKTKRNVVPFDGLRSGSNPELPSHTRHSNDITYMFYSGGTTGTAKGITHLAYDFIVVPARHGKLWEYTAEDVVYATSKKYFTHGVWPGLFIPLSFGATAVITRDPPRPDIVIAQLERHKVTKWVTVPTVIKNVLEALRTRPEPLRLPALSFAVSASEKIPPQVFAEFSERFGIEMHDSIGSSEIAYEWISNGPADFKRGSLGRPVFGCEVRLVDPDGNDIRTPNIPGECLIKSRTSCFFYWRKYDKSRETFVGDWARTGDNLYFDEDGYFWFSSRENDVFKVSGLWVSPTDIEAALNDHDAVLEAAVVGFDDAEGLTKARAFIVLREGHSESDALVEELKAQVRPLGGYKVPADFRFLKELPRTTLMKIDRKALRG
ncbi:MAG: AMP-binding protein [Hyphomicrobiaceae bacterium]